MTALCKGRSPLGERGLKYFVPLSNFKLTKRRSPLGERGLKLIRLIIIAYIVWSLSAWRAWIEIIPSAESLQRIADVALRLESVD